MKALGVIVSVDVNPADLIDALKKAGLVEVQCAGCDKTGYTRVPALDALCPECQAKARAGGAS